MELFSIRIQRTFQLVSTPLDFFEQIFVMIKLKNSCIRASFSAILNIKIFLYD